MKWGILATGTIAEKFADTVNHMEQEDETLIACASRNLEHGKAFASKYGIPKVYGSYDRQRSRCGLYCNAKQSPL